VNSRQVLTGLVGGWSFNQWNPNQVIAATNTTGILGHEADLIVVSKAGYLTEVEIKVSVSDFRREFKAETKVRKHAALVVGTKTKVKYDHIAKRYESNEGIVRRFYYAMPPEVYDKVLDEIPDYAGVIVVSQSTVTTYKRDSFTELETRDCVRSCRVKEAKILPARKLTAIEVDKVKTAVYFAYWRRMNQVEDPT